MQQTKSYWRAVVVAGVVGAFVASACVVSSSTDDSAAGQAGVGTAIDGSGGTSAAGTSSGGASIAGTTGSAGTSGTGGGTADAYECDPVDGGSLPSTAAGCVADSTNDCSKCLQTNCCAEVSACYATNPGNECGYGGPPGSGGEIICIQSCLQNGFADSGVDDSELRQSCTDQCLTSKANGATQDCPGPIGTQTNDLLACMTDHCLNECIGG